MKSTILISAFVLCFQTLFGQIQAITSGGVKVVLNENGSWKYIEDNKVNADNGDLGIWEVKYFVDDFGDPTNSGYITNSDMLTGMFSNSATSNSDLSLYFIVSDSANVAFKLFEYGRSEVKAYSTDYYTVKLKDSNGDIVSMSGTIYKGGNRLYIDPSHKKKHVSKMHQILMKGGKVTLSIKESDSLTSYKFSVDCTGYKNAFNKLFQ
jgi:hypothetical protein